MKKIILIVIALVIIILVIRSFNSNPVVKEDNTDNTNNTMSTTTNPVSIGDIQLADGMYSIGTASDAKITWSGSKVILKNWIDKGTIGLKEMNFEVKNGKLVSNKFVIDMTTITGKSTGAGGGEDKLTTHLKSADFFDVTQFPVSTFIAREFITGSTSGMFIAKGDLTIKGQTHEISIPVSFDTTKPGMIIVKGSASVDRTLWNVKYGSGKFFDNLGNNVINDIFTLDFEIEMKKI